MRSPASWLRSGALLLSLSLAACHLVFSHTGREPDMSRPDGRPDLPAADARDLGRDWPPDHPFLRDLQPDLQPSPDQPPKLDFTFPVKDGAVIASPIDLLFVIDNSGTMEQEQAKLVAQFPALIDALKLGGSLPDLRIGVISTDLGVNPYSFSSCEVPGGDGGKLQSQARAAGCTSTPTDPWISHDGNGVTNILGCLDPVQCVKDAFACIAPLGTGGCGFEHPLEAAKRALDPAIKINPSFLRTNALLAIVIITDEDDCSAAKPGLFDPSLQGVGDPLGPLTSFRCTRFGTTCNEPLAATGVKTGCFASGSWLTPVASYVSFFAGLKPAGGLFLAAIAGPSSPIEVIPAGGFFELKPSCLSSDGTAAPALRIHAVVDGVAAKGQTGLFNSGITPQNKPTPVSICSPDYAPAMRLLALKLAGAI